MKKRILLLTALLTLGVVVNAFAAAGTIAWLSKAADGSFAFPVTHSIVTFTVRPSANVWINYGPETNGVAYGLGTLHSSGTFS